MIKPYYQDGFCTIYNADCRDVLPQLEPVGLAVTSPPYNMRTRIRNGVYTDSSRETSEHFSKKYAHFHDAFPIEEYYEIHKTILTQMLSIAPTAFVNFQVVTGSKEAWFRLIGHFACNIKDLIIWDKGSGQPAMHGSVINRGSEIILALESNATAGRAFTHSNFKRGEMEDIWRIGRGGYENVKGHAATFPRSLAVKIIKNWCPAGGTVLDPFMGSGTTLRAAKDLGLKSIGIEIERKYCDIAIERLRQESLLPMMAIA